MNSVKKLIAIGIFILAVTWSCSGGGGTTAILPPVAPINTAPTPTEPIPDDQTPTPTPTDPHTIFVYDSHAPEIGTSDEQFYYKLDTGKSATARNGFISIGDILHDIDTAGISRTTSRLPTTPDAITIYNAVWCFENVPPWDAEAMGMSFRWYTKIYQDSAEYGNWQDNQWQTIDAVSSESGDIVAIDDQGRFHHLFEPDLKIRFIANNGIMIHSIDTINHRAYIRGAGYDTRVAFNTNYFFSADQWINAGGIWYSWNGYTWNGSTLTELSNKLSEFSTLWHRENPVLIAVGSRIEHGESVTYWIECNTGWMYRHTPSIDSLEVIIRLYQGDGTRDSGLAAKTEIKPILTANSLFYAWGGTIWKYNFNDSIISSFAANVEIWEL